jgi:hypothetical protein
MKHVVLMHGLLMELSVFVFYRVLDLEIKKEAVVKAVSSRSNAGDDDLEASSADEAEFDEYLDWRAKKSYK